MSNVSGADVFQRRAERGQSELDTRGLLDTRDLLRGMGIQGFATGTPMVQNTGLAMLHQGEAVIPASMNRGGAGGVVVNFNAPISANSPREVADMISDELMRRLFSQRQLNY